MSETEPAAPLSAAPVDIPYGFARAHGVVIAPDGEGGWLATLREGADPAVLIEVKRYLAAPLRVATANAADFDRLLSDHYAVDATSAMAGSLEGGDIDLIASGLPSAEDLLDSADDAPAIRLINAIIAEAVRQGVSDIHIEPYESGLVVRMRTDGVLREHLRMPPHVAPVVVSRIKVMARLDIAERRVPQDGRIALTLAGKAIDVRVSTLPSRAGERVVMRILDKDSAGIDFDVIGLTGESDRILREALAEPNGIILVTGPTGSGKTTTLYAALGQLNDGQRNILTVEDPVEYAVDGVGQTQVNPKVGLDFAAGLRAILRQDPDVVMVGEIRDRETADIAVQASLTGHLVLSTVHTNDAVGAITRLKDLKVEPFLLASTLRAVLAQRLVRKLCDHCREPVQADNSVAAMLGLDIGTVIWKPRGCDQCGHTGFKGRIGVFEAIKVDETVRRYIYAGGDEAMIAKHAFLKAPTLASAARAMVARGLTTPEEAIRVARREDVDA
ncbi:ATPase, T2SS/T4P/T4SS family [Sphingopyxis panaciterrulae]|uniref:General secretion pathway protein E n=1 Tax=Sphingopyxis panaciterrulae TaxID=462372 RepID=A0A7W9ER92_9SPHN|nr:general secretion pathway protein E [Sphingopyxis panaciterrulae]